VGSGKSSKFGAEIVILNKYESRFGIVIMSKKIADANGIRRWGGIGDARESNSSVNPQ